MKNDYSLGYYLQKKVDIDNKLISDGKITEEVGAKAKEHITSYLTLCNISYEDVIQDLEKLFNKNKKELEQLSSETDEFRNTICIYDGKFRQKVLIVLENLLDKDELKAFNAVNHIEFR